ncbi:MULTISPECIES: VOC family protein [unclassified Streptomyces]|uniref:VOC family protein n=1 Tax=unclassified Streptomyces TaxID=2593676 RepID=UPI000AF56E7B|nr:MULTISPECIES: VOC family protein [unclassified Streptomyces]MCX5149028.1 VOC family protein [Streptomyces sp. NBC_00320]WSN52075.1 VOC family protein [Streptomyces sp. NBC_01296]WSW58423.1 VOC family protein [Streptomyces sp. NBC_00998]
MFVNPVRHITFDSLEPYKTAEFWSAVTGFPIHPDDEEGDDEILLDPAQPGVPGLLFIRVPDAKSVKNRVHLDIQPPTGTRDETVERLIGLGAKLVDDRRREDGSGWTVLADPEGNELCIERSAAERGQA